MVAAHVLEHFRDPDNVLQKIFRILKDNGRLILEVPLTVDFFNAHHMFIFSRRTLTKLLEDNHFIIVKEFTYIDKIHQHENFAMMAKKLKI